MSLGVALFDNPKAVGGFYYHAGMKKPSEFFGKSDLPTGIVWLTNLSWRDLDGFGLAGSATFKEDGFLRATFKSIMKDSDTESTDSMEKAAKYLGDMVDVVAHHLYEHTGYDGKITQPLTQTILDVAKLGKLRKGRKNSNSDSIDYAAEQSKQTYQKCSSDTKIFGGKWYGIRFSRTEYAQDMLSIPVPTGKWSICNEPWLWVRSNIDTIPVLCKISVTKMPNDQVANLFTFGSSNKKGATRDWATSHEVMFLKEVLGCTVTIEKLLVAEKFTDPPLSLPWYYENSMSVAAGIYAENVWKALTVEHTPHAAWITAMDRIACSKMAAVLDDEDYRVEGFGTGTVQVVVKPGQYESLLKLCLEHQFVVPLNFLRHMEVEG